MACNVIYRFSHCGADRMGRSRDHFADIPRGTMDWVDYHGLENVRETVVAFDSV